MIKACGIWFGVIQYSRFWVCMFVCVSVCMGVREDGLVSWWVDGVRVEGIDEWVSEEWKEICATLVLEFIHHEEDVSRAIKAYWTCWGQFIQVVSEFVCLARCVCLYDCECVCVWVHWWCVCERGREKARKVGGGVERVNEWVRRSQYKYVPFLCLG